MSRTRLTTALVAATAAAALVPAAAQAGGAAVSPGSGGPNTQFFVKVAAAPVEQANDNGGFADVRFTPPAGSKSKCGQHHSPSFGVRGGKAVFDLEPQLTNGKKWCKGTYKFKVIVDKTGDGSNVKVIGSGSFKVR